MPARVDLRIGSIHPQGDEAFLVNLGSHGEVYIATVRDFLHRVESGAVVTG